VGFGDLPSPLTLSSPLRRRGPSDAQRRGVAQVARLGVALALSPLPPLSDDGGGIEARVRWPKQKIACIKVEYLQLSKIKSFQ
jgi:hypothetical protein